MACLGNINNKRSVSTLSKVYVTVHGKFYKQQALCLCHTQADTNKTKSTTDGPKCDMIGPPDPISNLRPIRFHVPEDETPIEMKFRLKRQEVQQWNQDFWTSHNTKFVEERKEFVAAKQLENNSESPVSADEMSVFYKAFLDKNWRTHLNYNMQWYNKNAQLVLLHIQVKLSRLKKTLTKKP